MGRNKSERELTDFERRFADRLKELREKKYTTQADFSEALIAVGLQAGQPRVANWESGARRPGLSDLEFIAAALDVSVSNLFRFEFESSASSGE